MFFNIKPGYSYHSFSRNFDAPFCETGVTFAFWIRPLKAAGPPYIFINQGKSGYPGITIQSRNFASSGEIKLVIFLEVNAESYKCEFDLATTTKSGGRFWKEWTFVGTTYDPTTSKFHCIFDGQLMEMQANGFTSTLRGSTVTFNTEQDRVFLLDDIVYIPAFSNQDAVNVLYNQSK